MNLNLSVFLNEKAVQCVKNYKRCEKELIDVLEEIDKHRSYLSFGVSSLFRYCTEKLFLSEAETYRFIQVTRKSVQVPELKVAIAEGRLTVSKASRIASVITKATQKEWIEKASHLTHREIEREVAKETPKAVRSEKITVLTPLRSELRFSISLDLEKKLERAKDVLRTKTIEETLEKLLDFTLKRMDPIEKAKRAVPRKGQPSTCELPAAKQIGRPIPQHIRHQVNLRDRGECTKSGCREKRWVEIHHIKPFSQGGDHALKNLTTLCSGHHSLVHEHQNSRWKKNAGQLFTQPPNRSLGI